MLTTPALLWDPPGPWVEEALCAQADPDLWHPNRGEDDKTTRAKAVCEGCPVRAECLTYALDHHEEWGIWGGLTVKERQALRRRRRAA